MSLWGTGGITLIIKWCRDSLLLLLLAMALGIFVTNLAMVLVSYE